MNDQRDEREFDAYLSGESPVSRQYAELAAAEPPPELDARILAAAEAEVNVVPLRRPWQRWATAVGVAATVMLAFTLVMQIAIEPFWQGDVSAPPASVVLMEKAELQQPATLEKKESPAATSPQGRFDTPAAPPGRVAADAAREQLLDDLAPAEAQPGLADMDVQVPVASSLKAPEPEALAGAAMKVGESVLITEARLADAVAVIRAARTTEADRVERQQGAARARARTADEGGMASDALPDGDPQAQLDEILRLYDAGDHIGAATRLSEFRTTHPEHPVSLRLADTLE